MQSLLIKTEEIIGKIDPNKIASSINNLEKITSNTDRIVQQIQSGKGVAGNIIYNNKLNQDIKTSTKNLTQITEQMKILLNTMQEQVYDIPELTSKIKPLLDEADKTIKATQKIWPISGAIRKDSKQSLTVPGAME